MSGSHLSFGGILNRVNWRGILLLIAGSVACEAQTVTAFASFDLTDGGDPHSPVMQASDGNFYGTTAGGGANSWGVVYKITPGGALTNLYSFTGGKDGGEPETGLVEGADGNLYGTTSEFGPIGAGTIFKITPAGTLTTLYGFGNNPDGASPYGALLLASDGNFYGTTSRGGVDSDGTVYQMTPTGVVTILYSFTGGADGANPFSTLIQGKDGNLYGTTTAGAGPGNGTIFSITPAGALTTVYTFPAYSGPQTSVAGMIQGSDGNFYGTTSGGGGQRLGSIFKLAGGTFSTLYSFTGSSDGNGPNSQLLQARDGNFYGTTADGTIFEITPGGVQTTLFNSTENPNSRVGYSTAGLIQAADGNLYGTCLTDGLYSYGCVFKLQLAVGAGYTCTNTTPPVITSIDSAGSYGGYRYFASGSWLEIFGSNLADPNDPRLADATHSGEWSSSDFTNGSAPTNLDGISVSINGKPAYVWFLSPGQINVQAPEDSATGSVAITVTNCNATSSASMFSRQGLAPGLLAPSNYSAQGKQYLVATFAEGGAYVLSTSLGASFGVNSRPAKSGDVIIVYGIGFGDVTPSILPGVIVTKTNTLTNQVTFSFGSASAEVSYQGLAGSFIGLYEFYVTVPAGLADGDYQINVAQNGTAIPQTVYLTVQN
jgi:uncharacterized protein (TIGR03437 family)